ncbi:MAG TPA: preprotein translocase subunit SecE [Spirochaetaceae bacterium]|nr:preprotein translocase subunit SecE [Spirochaetaceae bacterium]
MKITQYFRECNQELRRVTWPKKAEVVSATRVVLVSTFFSALILGAIDFLVSRGASIIFG